MKLKSLLIIFLILGFFMAVSAVGPAAAAFDAEVSIISEFDTATKTMRSSKEGSVMPLMDPNDDYFDNKAVVSKNSNRKLRIDISGNSGLVEYGDVIIDLYSGTNAWPDTDEHPSDGLEIVLIGHTPWLTNVTSAGCNVTVPASINAYNWILVTVKDANGRNPVFTWLKYQAPGALPAVVYTPTIATGLIAADSENLAFHKSLYLTTDAASPVYSWIVDSDGDKIAQSEELSKSAVLSLDIGAMSDANFVIRYSDSRSEGTLTADGWNGKFGEVKIKHAEFETFLTDGLNPLTNYSEPGDYSILVPDYEDLQSTELNSAEVYYDGKLVAHADAEEGSTKDFKPAYDPNDTNTWIKIPLTGIVDADSTADKWTSGNGKVVVVFDDDEKTRVVGADDGVGPRLIRAYVRYDEDDKLILKFSEDLDPSTITRAKVKPDIYLSSSDYIDAIALNPENESEIILTASDAIDEGTLVNLQVVDGSMSIKDLNGNPAYVLDADRPVAVERIIEEVKVVDVDRAGAGSTTIDIVFNAAMNVVAGTPPVNNKDFYSIEYVPGLVEKDDNGVEAKITSATLQVDNVTVKLVLEGAIESTAAEELPKVAIVQNADGDDLVGGDPLAPVREADKAARMPDDEVGPYIKAASFNYNPENGMDAAALIEDSKPTLTLFFSEKVKYPGDMDENTFISGDWDDSCLDNSYNSACEQDPNGMWRVIITLNPDELDDPGQLPYTSPAFAEVPTIRVDSEDDRDDIQDEDGNEASDYDEPVLIANVTPLWVSKAKTTDPNGNGIVEKLTVTFGKNISIAPSKFERRDKVIEVNGDPNIISTITSGANTITVNLKETNRDVNTAWTPTVSFDLKDDTIIEDATVTDGIDMVADFSIAAKDGVAPVLVELDPNSAIGVYQHDLDPTGPTYWWYAKLEFSEDMDPNIWQEPTYARRFFDGTLGSNNVVIETFLTNESEPPGTSAMSCGGDSIALLLRTTVDVTDDSTLRLKIQANGKFVIDDVSANITPNRVLKLADAGLPPNIWTIPDSVKDYIVPTMKSMRIFGTITKDPNNAPITSGEVYAMHRDDLFLITENAEGDPNKGAFYIDVTKALGATNIQYDNGEKESTYFIKVFGKESVGSQRGFVNGEPIILVVKDNSDADNLQIATTAFTANPAYSVKFNGSQLAAPTEHPIDLAKREIITLKTGWNLISTSLDISYVDSTLSALSGFNPDDFTNYMYAPTDILAAEEGSIPSAREELDDISAVLFTLSHSFFTGNIFYDPAIDPIFPVEDELADRFNKTPAFCTGRGYYIYIAPVGTPLTPIDTDPADTRLPAEWKVVLFGEKVPSPEYKLKVTDTTNLIGHWGGLFYNTYDGMSVYDSVKTYLPSTVDITDSDTQVYVDDIAGIDEDIVAINVCDIDGDPVDVSVVATFWSYPGLNNAVWYADLPGFSDMNFVAPGVGYWMLIDADAADGPFFVSYLPQP